MMRRLPVLTALVACGALLAPVGVAEAAKKSSKPAIKRVTPMRVTVGKKITIRGVNFSGSRRRNTVLFSSGKRSAFAKPSRASRKKLVVRIPASVENLLAKSSGTRKPTRLKLRVVTKRYGKVTTKRVSPIVVSAVKIKATFKNGVLTTPELKIQITRYKIIKAGQKGNEYGEKPVIAFWYKTTNLSGDDVDPATGFISHFNAYQDNNPNAENELDVGSLPDDRFLDSQLENIKKGGTVENAMAYELDDLDTPVDLVASEGLDEVIGKATYKLR